jgi:hypothetical protein
MLRLIMLLSALGFFAGCETRPVGVQTASFNEEEFRGFDQRGTASLHGQVRVHLGGSRVAGSAAQKIYLVPLTSYTQEWLTMMKEGKELPPADPRIEKYTRSASPGHLSAYTFDKLPAGKYVVFSRVEWGPVRGRPRSGSGADYAFDVVELTQGQNKRGFNITNR